MVVCCISFGSYAWWLCTGDVRQCWVLPAFAVGWYARYCMLFCSYITLSGVGLCYFGVPFGFVFYDMPFINIEYNMPFRLL